MDLILTEKEREFLDNHHKEFRGKSIQEKLDILRKFNNGDWEPIPLSEEDHEE